jgi:hypothetical protein
MAGFPNVRFGIVEIPLLCTVTAPPKLYILVVALSDFCADKTRE